jgi:hypothetical protein
VRFTRSTGCVRVSVHDHDQSPDYDDDFGSNAFHHTHDRIERGHFIAHHLDDPADHDDVKHERTGELRLVKTSGPAQPLITNQPSRQEAL